MVERRASGVFHAVDGHAPRIAQIAAAASQAAGKGGATRSIPLGESRKTLGPFADALALDQLVRSRRAAELGWRPAHPDFLGEAAQAYRDWKSSQG
jgi:nucleoside-diphosphate-sugar epimerase